MLHGLPLVREKLGIFTVREKSDSEIGQKVREIVNFRKKVRDTDNLSGKF